jgi:hypothetical protein
MTKVHMATRQHAALGTLVLGVLCLVVAVIAALGAEWTGRGNLDDDPRIARAATYVSAFRDRAARLPSRTEFAEWMKAQPEELRYEGRGFEYEPLFDFRCPTRPCRFRFTFWGGNSEVTWYPAGQEPRPAFALTFLALSLALLSCAYAMLPTRKPG